MSGASLTMIGRFGLPAAIISLARLQHARQQLVERRRRLQVAQSRRVGRGYVDREVARHVVELSSPRT